MSEFQVEPLVRQQRRSAARVLAAAFQDDPLFRFVVPDDQQRRRWLPVFEYQLVRNTQPYGASYVACNQQGQIAGVMAVTPPGHFPHSLWANLRLALNVILRPTPWCPHLRTLWPIRHYGAAFDQMHYRPPHWYLDVIGVDPAYHRQGVGKQLMQRLIEHSQHDRNPIWLETQTADNVPYYESFGFEVRQQLHPAPGGPPTWGMLRPVSR